MEHYDPYVAPSPEEWNALQEAERIILVEEYHRQAGEEMPNNRLHATIHTIVESQVALGDEIPIATEFDRLMREGLDRHEAIHAIASVLVEHIYDLETGDPPEDPQKRNEQYYAKVRAITAKKWREM